MRIVNEKGVARLWKSGRLSSFLDDLGNEVEVICAGRASTRPGCDFQDAVISVNAEKVTGDVELHLTSDLWKKHGHHENPAYNGVILHVVMWQKGDLPVKLEDGSALPTVILSRYMTADDLCRWREKAGRPHCMARLPGASLRDVILRAGLDRFRGKASRFASALHRGDPEQVLYKGICRALGYSRNVLPFEALADRLAVEDIYRLSAGSLQGKKDLLLGCAGFAPGPEDVHVGDWQLTGVRPSNHPARRLAYLAHLLHKHEAEGLVGAFLRTIRRVSPVTEARCLEEALLLREVPSLLGKGRAGDIIINQVLPFSFACGVITADIGLASRSMYIYLNYGALPGNDVLRYMRSLLLLEGRRNLNACAQQGLLHIYHTFCRTKECGSCPVATFRTSGRA
jgi:hypothetical protein